jgi:hypothetical protein
MGIKKNKHGQHVITKLLPGGAAQQSGHIFPGVKTMNPSSFLSDASRSRLNCDTITVTRR